MRNWFASRTLTIAGMTLVPVVLLTAGYSGPSLLVVGLSWLGLLGCLHLLAGGRRPADAGPARHDPPSPPDKPRMGAILSDRLVYERTTAAILEDFVNCGLDDFEENMGTVLSRLGSYTGVHRCYLYRFGGHDQESVRLLNWQAPGDGKAILPPSTLPAAETILLGKILEQDPVVLVNEVGETRHPLVNLLPWSQNQESVRSCGAVPILQDGKRLGFLGFDDPETNEWGEGEKSLLQLVANLFSTIFSRLDAQQVQLEAMATLEASNHAKRDFLANMSHEIRTPLNGVIGMADLLSEMDLTPLQKEYVGMIHESGTRLMSLLRDILDLSKIEARQLVIDSVETDLHALVEDLVSLTAPSAQAQGLELVCRLGPGLPERVLLDPDRLGQILTNLLNNAIKFTETGHIHLDIEPGKNHGEFLDLCFRVSDTGIGISEEQADRIFKKFTQADPSTTRRFGGTGLGLSICRHLVELMGGKIWANGVLGEGSTFSFTIRAKPLAPALPVVQQESVLDVLLVTGHELGGTVLAEQICGLGHRCQITGGIEETRSLLSRAADGDDEFWNFVILDPTTLSEDLDPVLTRIQDMPASRRPRVVLLSRFDGTHHDPEPEDGRPVLVLSKPVRTGSLADLLEVDSHPEDRSGNAVSTAENQTDKGADNPARAPRILLAEDNLFNQKVTCGILQLLGCQVSLAADGAQALAMVQDGEFDMIFMDCEMPEMDGYEATRRIRQIPGAAASVPIIALTAKAFSQDREACLEAGMNDFMTKPVNKAQLDRMLAMWKPITCPSQIM